MSSNLLAASRLLSIDFWLVALLPVATILYLVCQSPATPPIRFTRILGMGLGAILLPIVLAIAFDPAPNSHYEENFALAVAATMAVGSIAGSCFVRSICERSADTLDADSVKSVQ